MVNVNAPDTVAFAVVPLVGVTDTEAVGSELSLTVYVAVEPSTTLTEDEPTVTPAVSLSVIVNVTPVTVRPETAVVKTTVSSSSSRSSSVICTVPVAAVWPEAIVNAEGSE